MSTEDEIHGQHVHAVIEKAAREYSRAQKAEIERRLLEGENRVEVPYLPNPTDNRVIVYQIPGWREHPILRFKIELERWKFRRQKRVEREAGR